MLVDRSIVQFREVKILAVHTYTITKSYMRNLVKMGLIDFAVAKVLTYIVRATRALPFYSILLLKRLGVWSVLIGTVKS